MLQRWDLLFQVRLRGRACEFARPDARGSPGRGRAASTPPPHQRLQWAGRRAPPPQPAAPFHTTGPGQGPKPANQRGWKLFFWALEGAERCQCFWKPNLCPLKHHRGAWELGGAAGNHRNPRRQERGCRFSEVSKAFVKKRSAKFKHSKVWWDYTY